MPEDDPDIENLEQAMSIMKDVSNYGDWVVKLQLG